MYRIRLHGRGGQGIKTASQVIGSAFFREGFTVQDAPRYGAERRGAPISAYVRAAHGAIHERGVIEDPDLVVVADDSLPAVAAAGVLAGVTPHTVFVIESELPAASWRARLGLQGLVLNLPPGAHDAVGARIAGATVRLTGAIARASLAAAIEDELAQLGGDAQTRTEVAAFAAFDAFAVHAGLVRPREAATLRPIDWIDLPLEDVARAAPSIRAPLTSFVNRTGVWRSSRPVIDYTHCNRCSWVCSTLCPDSAIAVDADRTPRIDYDHCKGCLVCVAVCPPHAIRVEPEPAR